MAEPQMLDVTIDTIEIGDLVDEGRQVVMISGYEVTAAVRHANEPRASPRRWTDIARITLSEGEKIRVIRGVAVSTGHRTT